MLLSSLPGVDGSRCTLTLEPQGWLRATWRGFVDMAEALRGADNYLHKLAELHSPYLLNDNVELQGPWFNSIEWLERIWVPMAVNMGLRYVAHVAQADLLSDTITTHFKGPHVGGFELHIFQHVAEAEAWLLHCQMVVAGVE